MTTENSIDLEKLSNESGLPLYILDYFENQGMFEISPETKAANTADNVISYRTKFAASMRNLGFSLNQIVSLVMTGSINTPMEAEGA